MGTELVLFGRQTLLDVCDGLLDACSPRRNIFLINKVLRIVVQLITGSITLQITINLKGKPSTGGNDGSEFTVRGTKTSRVAIQGTP